MLDLEEGTIEKDAMGQGQHFEHNSRIESVLPGQGFQESKLFVPVVMQKDDKSTEDLLTG